VTTVETALSVVLITRNQEWNVRRLVQSALDGVRSVEPALGGTSAGPRAEVVLVDSDSTDATVAVACEYPITVVRLEPGQRLNPAVGRLVGHTVARGSMLLFLDGDMELVPGWLPSALAYLDGHPDVAVVTGPIVDLPLDGASEDVPMPPAGGEVRAEDVRHGRGAALFRRAMLDAVGSFDPDLYAEEEPELALRIRRAGGRVVRLDRPIAFHYTEPRERIRTLFARRRRRLFLGNGQNLRRLLGEDGLGIYVRERSYGATSLAAGAAALAVIALCLVAGGRVGLGLAAVATLGVLAGQTVRKRSVYGAVHSLVHRAMLVEGTVRGFMLTPRGADAPAPRFTVVHDGSGVGRAA
jgi:glycosyltransferase involved in cell wall biosynthesis